jgi:hypothetical protein
MPAKGPLHIPQSHRHHNNVSLREVMQQQATI